MRADRIRRRVLALGGSLAAHALLLLLAITPTRFVFVPVDVSDVALVSRPAPVEAPIDPPVTPELAPSPSVAHPARHAVRRVDVEASEAPLLTTIEPTIDAPVVAEVPSGDDWPSAPSAPSQAASAQSAVASMPPPAAARALHCADPLSGEWTGVLQLVPGIWERFVMRIERHGNDIGGSLSFLLWRGEHASPSACSGGDRGALHYRVDWPARGRVDGDRIEVQPSGDGEVTRFCGRGAFAARDFYVRATVPADGAPLVAGWYDFEGWLGALYLHTRQVALRRAHCP